MSRSRLVGALAVACVVALSAMPGHAAYTKKVVKTFQYDASAMLAKDTYDDVTCDVAGECLVAKDGTVDIGGVTFPKIGGKSRTALVNVKIRDASETPVYFSLCQDIDRDSSCGEGAGDDPTNPNQVEEPSYRGCSPGSRLMTISTKHPTTVFIYAASTGCTYLDEAQDTYIATQGTISLIRYIKR